MQTNTLEVQTGQEGALQPARQQSQKAALPMGRAGIEFENFASVYRFAECVAKSGMAPKGMQSQEAITVAIQMGLEVGLPPMTALQNIAVINGRPSIWGDAQLGIVRACGQLARYEEAETNNASDLLFRELCLTDDPEAKKKMRLQLAKAQAGHTKDAVDFGVTVFVQRSGFDPIFNRFTVADAKQANLWGKEGPWRQYPARMLKFRARSFALRDQFGDALKGLLTVEEATDLPPITEPPKPVFGQPESIPIKSRRSAQITESAVPAEIVTQKAPTPEPAAAAEPTKRPKLTTLTDWMSLRGFTWAQLKPIILAETILENAETITNVNDLTEAQAETVHAWRKGFEDVLTEGGAK